VLREDAFAAGWGGVVELEDAADGVAKAGVGVTGLVFEGDLADAQPQELA
jgi:hypothetical protein